MNRKFVLYPSLAVALALCAAGQWGCGGAKGTPDGGGRDAAPDVAGEAPGGAVLEVRAEPVGRREWTSAVEVSGDLASRSVVEVRPEVTGRLTAVYFDEGDGVRQGQLVAEIDATGYQLAYDQAAAALAVAEAGLGRAQVAVEHAAGEKTRADNLLRSGGITQKDHAAAVTGEKDAAAQVTLAEAQVKQARAALAVVEKSLRDCKVTAPASGQVQKRNFDKGTLVAAGSPLLTLVDNGQLELECEVPSHQLAAIRPGQKATFQTPTWGGRLFNGVVSSVNPAVAAASRSAKVILRIGNPGGELRSGMYARGTILTETVPDALVVSRDALIPGKEGTAAAVYAVREGRARRVEIELGGTREGWARVLGGLGDGDMVVTEIGPSLKDGSPVKLRQ
ncbi:MAG: efflux RND transporter periplasmic adaptor subunit [Acidobacteriota bacterium]|jgi:membrane fusion protein (multidrug efflux system)|nr:efflux RND transporter periplasmic adaptor subunit [Acidobacteriota bacterium]